MEKKLRLCKVGNDLVVFVPRDVQRELFAERGDFMLIDFKEKVTSDADEIGAFSCKVCGYISYHNKTEEEPYCTSCQSNAVAEIKED